MELIVIRHGRPERVEGVAGGADPDLTDVGHRQAAAVADWIASEHLDAIYVSPMARARQTCEPLERRFELEASVDERVREFDHSESSYIPLEELRKDKAKWKAYVASEETMTRSDFAGVLMPAIDEIVERHRGQRVAVVCHGGVINIIAARVLGIADRMFFNPDYTSINRFMFASSGESSVLSLNDTGHLRSTPELLLS
ncbi:MAG: putative phosphoglycerate mutase [Acidimicrobiales bacterium]|jgi:2,3-bisphosphoglycerate-dependent phosphoglycerate mutase